MKPKKILFNSKAKNIRSVCPYCGDFFSDGDEVILCPVDNTPHHTKCWVENRGCSKGDFDDIPLIKTVSPWRIIKTIIFICFGLFSIMALIFVIGLFVLDIEGNGTDQLTPSVISEENSPVYNTTPAFSPTPLPYPGDMPTPLKNTPKNTPRPSAVKKGTPSSKKTPVPTPDEDVNPGDLEPYKEETISPVIQRTEPEETSADTAEIQQKAVKIAMAQIGKPYVWETTGPDTFDCAGLCGYAYWMASGKEWNKWHIFYISDMLKLCNINRDLSEIRPGDLLVRNNYEYLKPFEIRNEEGPEYEKYNTHAAGWPYGESPVHDYGHIGMYVGKVTCKGTHYKHAVVEARGKDWGVVIDEWDRDGNGQLDWGNFFYRPSYVDE